PKETGRLKDRMNVHVRATVHTGLIISECLTHSPCATRGMSVSVSCCVKSLVTRKGAETFGEFRYGPFLDNVTSRPDSRKQFRSLLPVECRLESHGRTGSAGLQRPRALPREDLPECSRGGRLVGKSKSPGPEAHIGGSHPAIVSQNEGCHS